MSWESSRRRHQLVHAALADIAATGHLTEKLAALVDEEFGDLGGFLREVQMRWYRGFDARLDAVLEEQPQDMEAALTQVWLDLAEAMPEARCLLDVYAEHPALAELHEHHRRTLYAATGVSTVRRPAPPKHRRCRWFFVPRTSPA